MIPSLQDIDKLPVEVIQAFRRTKVSSAIPEHLQRYILHLDKAAELFNVKGNISEICKELILAFPEDDLSMPTAKRRVYDALNFFHLNNTVRNEAWDMYYADRLEALGRKAEMAFDGAIAVENGPDEVFDLETVKLNLDKAPFSTKNYAGLIQEARRCYTAAHDLRTKRDEDKFDPEQLKPIIQLINPDVSPERLGLKQQNLRRLWSETTEFINKLELEEEQKERLRKESAEVIDVDYEDIGD